MSPNVYAPLINKLYIKSKCIEVYGGFRTSVLQKIVNCNRILSHVADQDYIEFMDQATYSSHIQIERTKAKTHMTQLSMVDKSNQRNITSTHQSFIFE